MTAQILALICKMALTHGVDPYRLAAIVEVESSWNPKAYGALGEIGLTQIRPEFYQGADDLWEPRVNLSVTAESLARLKVRCPLKGNGLHVICHNTGVRGAFRVQRPNEHPYYKKVQESYAKLKAEKIFENAPVQAACARPTLDRRVARSE